MMINQIIKFALMFAAITMAILLVFGFEWNALAFFIGTLWGTVNLYLIARVTEHVLLTKRYGAVIFWLLIKFPLLYLGGYFILAAPLWNLWYAVSGLFVIFLSIIGCYLLSSKKILQRI